MNGANGKIRGDSITTDITQPKLVHAVTRCAGFCRGTHDIAARALSGLESALSMIREAV
jgi:hypothetical protein